MVTVFSDGSGPRRDVRTMLIQNFFKMVGEKADESDCYRRRELYIPAKGRLAQEPEQLRDGIILRHRRLR